MLYTTTNPPVSPFRTIFPVTLTPDDIALLKRIQATPNLKALIVSNDAPKFTIFDYHRLKTANMIDLVDRGDYDALRLTAAAVRRLEAEKPAQRVEIKQSLASQQRDYIKVLPKDIATGDVIDPQDGSADMLVSSVEKIDAGTIWVKSEIGAIKRQIKYTLSNGLAHVVSGSKLDAYKLNAAVAPMSGGHPLWKGAA